ncbi:MAG: branched-chain amino acid ABC transporter permease [Xanthobacteraceae bacterium]
MQSIGFRTFSPAVIATLLLAVIGAAAFFSGNVTGQLVAEMMIRIMIVVGIYIFTGNSGILSFGHIGFMCIGAYSAAWFTCCTLPLVKPLYLPGLPEFLQLNAYPFWAGILSAAVVSGLVALVLGIVISRLAGTAASIATFAFLAIVFSVYSNWESVTGGTSSISNIPVDVGVVTATVGAVVSVWIAFLHQISRYGLMLRAVRDEPVAARSSGVLIARVRLVAWVLSAIVVGVGGAFYSSFIGILTVDAFYLTLTFLTLAMLIVGGVGSLSGAVIGVIALTIVTELLRMVENSEAAVFVPKGLQEVGLGIAVILILIFRPRGLLNGREFGWSRKR